MPDILADVTIAQVAVVAGIVVGAIGAVRKLWPWLSRFKDFLDDLMGEPARPGVPERPGVMSRLASHETRIETVEYNTQPNGGGSAYDALMREVRAVGSRLDTHITAAEDIHEQQDRAIAQLAEALPIVARSTPHPDDADHQP